MNKKKILAIILVVVVLLLGGASVYVATQLSTRKAVAPTAPESKPAAFDCSTFDGQQNICVVTLDELTSSSKCQWFSACNKCGSSTANESTICGVTWVSSEACTLTGKATEDTTDLVVIKEAKKDDVRNVAGTYYLGDAITSVVKGQTFVYKIGYENKGTTTIESMTITDTLTGNNLDHLSFVDSGNGCSYDETKRSVTCSIGAVEAGKGSQAVLRVKVDDKVTNDMVIKNTATVVYGTSTKTATVDLKAVVGEEKAVIEGEKTAYKNVTSNTPGKYTLSTLMETVSKSQIYVYTVKLKNTSTVKATGVTIKDSLKDVTELTYMDAVAGCNWNTTNLELTCSTTLDPDEEKTFSFRVKASDGVANGTVISNTAKVTADNANSLELIKDLAVSTVVGCNHTCTTDEECTTGLACDTTTNKCRKTACLTEDDCVCGVVVTATKAPTTTRAAVVTKVATATATPVELTEAGILDIPGVAAFGGGLILAIVGILLAL